MVDEGVAGVVVTCEELRSHAATEIAIGAGGVDIESALHVSGMFLRSVCHMEER